ncbi:MAG TPA: hypothetical protein PLX23_06820 [Candidatus Hydrogenedens sp.]|nr:hypothetical protein [Candidatus Hydrogenedens sp.]
MPLQNAIVLNMLFSVMMNSTTCNNIFWVNTNKDADKNVYAI